MPIYITQGNYTEQALKGMVLNPEDRQAAVAGLLESVGGKLIDYYITAGEYDFLIISEGNSLKEMIASLMIAGSTGGVKNLKTFEALTTIDAKTAMVNAKKGLAAFKSAGRAQ